MLYTRFVILFLFGSVQIISAHPQRNYRRQLNDKGDCAFGDEYNDGCNHCICHGKAGSTCTRIPNCSDSSTDSSTKQSSSRGHCTLGQEFKKDCNVCTCHGESGYVCTSKECTVYKDGEVVVEGSNKYYPSSPTRAPTDTKGKCILGHKFFSGCDLCTCYGEYFGYRCERMENCRTPTRLTTSTTTRLPSYEKFSENCSKGRNYHDGYYYCTCRSDNLGYVCKSTLSTE